MANASYPYNSNQSLVVKEVEIVEIKESKKPSPERKLNIVQYCLWLVVAVIMGFLPKPVLSTVLFFPFAFQQSLLHKSKEQITIVEDDNQSMRNKMDVLVSQNQDLKTDVSALVSQNKDLLVDVNVLAVQNQDLQISVKSILENEVKLETKQEELGKIANKAQIRSHLTTQKLQEMYVLNRQLKAEIARQQREFETQIAQVESVRLNNDKVATKAHGYISIDGNNFKKSYQELNLDIDWRRLKNYLTKLVGNVDDYSLAYYTGMDKRRRNQQGFFDRLGDKYGYEVITFDIARYSDGTRKVKGDDMAIAVDLLKKAQAGDSVVLVTGDGDFIPLVEELLNRNVKVTLIGALHKTNSDWQKFAQRKGFYFISLDSISNLIIKK